MSTSPHEQHPAIKILLAPVVGRLHTPKEPRARMTAISTYRGDGQRGHWDDIVPIPVVCVTNDKAAVARSLQTIPEQEWQVFEQQLSQLPSQEPGLYFLK